MPEEAKIDFCEIEENILNFSKPDVNLAIQRASPETEEIIIEEDGIRKESGCFSEFCMLNSCCFHNRETPANSLCLLQLQSVWRSRFPKEDNVLSTCCIIKDLFLFAVAEVIQRRKRSTASSCLSRKSICDANTSNATTCSLYSVYASSWDVVNLSALRQYLDEYERNQLHGEDHSNFALTSNIRKQIILWLFDIAQLFDLNSETVALTVAFMDKLIGKQTVSRHFLHSTIGGCLCTFSKWLDLRPVLCSEIASVVNISSNLLRLFEEIILLSVDWRFQLQTAHSVFSTIARKFKQFHCNTHLSETLLEEVVCKAEMYLNMSLLCEELSTYDHSIIVLVVLGLLYKDMLKTNNTHEKNNVVNDNAVAELLIEIAKECGVSKECFSYLEHLLESSVISNEK
ncbi:hypothetical protein GpartN1_g5207.t1 [Galdieria partita]|uniref:Cyclin N-terminal domain-containing protein n=1 Tax=Galdieria partita TaxID=83374 RepID=A0A9C7PZG3_9RHOD|nr:hypothetical protein GpartN1_g993.t1 [Galdieria partita]GJQ13416.1 hypothetical protein GpartN1_g5207.t1 [Galdieria partita]